MRIANALLIVRWVALAMFVVGCGDTSKPPAEVGDKVPKLDIDIGEPDPGPEQSMPTARDDGKDKDKDTAKDDDTAKDGADADDE